MLKRLMFLRFTLKIGFWGKKEVHLLVDINSYYLALLQDTVDTDLKHITSTAQKFESKILKCYPEKYKIEKELHREKIRAMQAKIFFTFFSRFQKNFGDFWSLEWFSLMKYCF